MPVSLLKRPRMFCWLMSGVVVACSGCGLVFSPGTVVRQIRQVQQVRQQGVQVASLVSGDGAYVQSLKPLPGGPGIIIFEPVVTNEPKAKPLPNTKRATGDLAAFGAGCGRWLNLAVGGHGEFGQTPSWGYADDVRRALKRTNLQLQAAEVGQVARLTPATHAATGHIARRGNTVTLTYQLHQAHPQQKALGAPITLSGTRDQIVAKLPVAARQMAQRLGAAKPRVPNVKIGASELAFLGTVPWKAQSPVDAATARRLLALAEREPLAGILYLRSGAVPPEDDPSRATVIVQLMKIAPDNTLLQADCSRLEPPPRDTYPASLQRAMQRFPNNYLLLTVGMNRHWHHKRWTQAQQLAERSVQAAPRNAFAWLQLGSIIEDRSQAIRNARYANQITPAEWRKITPMYVQWLDVTLHASRLAPHEAYVWSQVSAAAAFSGHGALADQAFQTALQKPVDPDIYQWGLNLYQPKWQGDSRKLLQVARLAIKNSPPNTLNSATLIEAIEYGKLAPYKEELLKAALQRHPQDPKINYELGAVYHYFKRSYRRAEKYYLIAIALDKNYARPVSSLGDLHYFVKNDSAGAGKLYQKAVLLEPRDGALRANLARWLANVGRRQEAVAELRRAQQVGFKDRTHPVWSAVQVN